MARSSSWSFGNLLCIILHAQSARAQQTPDLEEKVGWIPSPRYPYGRGTLEIVWTCVFTLFICFWSIQHPNLDLIDDANGEEPNGGHTKWLGRAILCIPYCGRKIHTRWGSKINTFSRRVTTIAMCICGPEFVLGWAILEYKYAGQLRDEANRLFAEEEKLTPPPAGLKRIPWTRTHGFCAIMRGFVVHHGSGKDPHERTWTEKDLKTGDQDFRDNMKNISKEDIMDKSKADALIKGLACLQIVWFVIQQSARYLERLPISELELATIAYVACTLPTYFFYLSKPCDMRTPFVLYAEHAPQQRDQNRSTRTREGLLDARVPYTETSSRLPSFDEEAHNLLPTSNYDSLKISEWGFLPTCLRDKCPDLTKATSKEERMGMEDKYGREVGEWVCITYLMAALFGAIHCWAWNFSFPTVAELWLWRVASLLTAVIPFVYLLRRLFFYFRERLFHVRIMPYGWELVAENRPLAIELRFGFYAAMLLRIYIIVAVFVTLREQPAGLYGVLDWLKLIPHFH